MKLFGYDPATAVTPGAVADVMAELVVSGKYVGGTCVEVSSGGTRTLGTWNISAPESGGTSLPQDGLDQSYAPLIALMQKDRGRSA